MNNILQLKGQFQHRKNPNKPGPIKLPKGTVVSVDHLRAMKKQLEQVLIYWQGKPLIGGALVSVYYKQVTAKSNRLKTLLGEGSKSPNESIRGARFEWEPELDEGTRRQKHVFTHFVSLEVIRDSIGKLGAVIDTAQKLFGDLVTDRDVERLNTGECRYAEDGVAKTVFIKTVVDAYYVEKFKVDDEPGEQTEENTIVTLYRTGIRTLDLLNRLGIDAINAQMIDETTLRLNPNEIRILQEKVPYLIAMEVKDLSEVTRENITPLAKEKKKETVLGIPDPQQEPVVGVIDTCFDERVYFHKWVKYEECLSDEFDITDEDREHGTAVSSIIVDGPAFNPGLEDGCGRFQVKHFGVAKAGRFSSFTILKQIREIVGRNRSIKVWNLSLGSAMEIHDNFISPEAAELDKIQSEYDVIFVVAGTNKGRKQKSPYRIGAPADSLNSLVVNAVDFSGKSATYTRVGPVLSFFHKPDVSYYGGDGPDKIVVCEPLGKAYVVGTSFAAPWITRKVAYLIHVMGLSREVAKALIIDAAAGWKRQDDQSHAVGYGVVPRRIEEILYSGNDEIKFILSGVVDDYETFTYNLPIPRDKNAYPYYAKATLVYFPKSNRYQGVDYTNTEMDLHLGRVMIKKAKDGDKDDKVLIKSIDCNKQADDGLNLIYEENARKLYRKWDNVKHINEVIKDRKRPKKSYEAGMWGLNIITKERLKAKEGRGLPFGVVVTLKEMNGVNRIDDFIKMCIVRGWLVNRLDVKTQVDIYQKAEEEVEWE